MKRRHWLLRMLGPTDMERLEDAIALAAHHHGDVRELSYKVSQYSQLATATVPQENWWDYASYRERQRIYADELRLAERKYRASSERMRALMAAASDNPSSLESTHEPLAAVARIR